MFKIESLLSARLFLQPQLVGDRIFFLSNLSGHISLYAMDYGGSVPEPLLPPNLALQNPHLIGGKSFHVFPKLGKILVMTDRDGDENYQPMLIPIDGGYPQPSFDNKFANNRVHFGHCDEDKSIIYLGAESRVEPIIEAFRGNLETGELVKLGESPYGHTPDGVNSAHDKAVLVDSYTAGDSVLYYWTAEQPDARLLYGVPLEQRSSPMESHINGIGYLHFTHGDSELLFVTTLFEDTVGLGCLRLDQPEKITAVRIRGVVHTGIGELESMEHLEGQRYLLTYNIDGCSWLYEAVYDEGQHRMDIQHVLCGLGSLSNGVLEAVHYNKHQDKFSLAFSTATSPTQIYTVEGPEREMIFRHTNERILAIAGDLLSGGEDASFTSYDGTRVSARLYRPAASLNFEGPRPVIYYIHGGPQGQERPDFAWFSMPIIQFLTLNGFAVFVPNVRGSTGYGMSYMKQVDRDWGGRDRLDHVHAVEKFLPTVPGIDASRVGVVGRSYGGYMTLTLAGRHPELWGAAVDMFGPYDLVTFCERIPETWKPYFRLALGDAEIPEEREFLAERSPSTYIHQLAAPMLVIQGKNDPRVVERESHDVVEKLRASGKNVEYLMFENEGHDVLKYENRVTVYNAITDFFAKHLKP